MLGGRGRVIMGESGRVRAARARVVRALLRGQRRSAAGALTHLVTHSPDTLKRRVRRACECSSEARFRTRIPIGQRHRER